MAGRESKEVTTANNQSAGKEKALETTLANLKKRFGEGAIMKLGDASGMTIESVPTGAISLDLALGVGGLPRGRVIEIYGPESSGKTTICLHVIAEAQRMGGMAAFIDVEHALDPIWATKCGVKVADLYVSQPDTGEQALEIAEALIRSGAMDVVVVDSVAALVPRAEIEGEMGDSHVGMQARLMSQALRKLAGAISNSNTVMIFTNQLRLKIGVMFGNPETTTGGQALKFYSSVRLDVRKTETIKQGDEAIGNRTRVTVKKNKVAPPFRVAEFDIMANQGISKEGCLLDVGVELGVIDKRGAFFSFNEQRLGQGRENVKNFLVEHPDIAQTIEARVRQEAGIGAGEHVVSPQPTNGIKLTVKPVAPPSPAAAAQAADQEDELEEDDEFDGLEGIGDVKQGRLVE